MVDMPETETLASINWPPSPVVSTVMDEVPSPAMIVPELICHLYSGLAVGTTVLSFARNDGRSFVNRCGDFNGDYFTPLRRLRRGSTQARQQDSC